MEEEEEEQVSGPASNRWPSWPPQLLWFSFTRLPPGSRNRLESLFNQCLTMDSFFVSVFWLTFCKKKTYLAEPLIFFEILSVNIIYLFGGNICVIKEKFYVGVIREGFLRKKQNLRHMP